MRKSRETPRTSWIVTLVATAIIVGGSLSRAHAAPPIHIAFHWNLHQPIFWPYESVTATANNSRYGFDVLTIHSDRTGPYTAWPIDAVQAGMGAGLGNLGASISFSGSLMENLNAMSAAGQGFQNWQSRWRAGAGWTTSLGNPRVDVLAFGYHNAPLALLDPFEIGLQIQLHREKVKQNLGDSMAQSKGLFPPAGAMSERLVPSLVAQGIEWVIVDNIHVDRTAVDYPFTSGSNLPPPNRADQVNAPTTSWIQLNGLSAPGPVSASWGVKPHWIRYVEPSTGQVTKMIVVPAARYESAEDARGGFGALQYETVLSQYEASNTDPNHPILVVLQHDGDNGGGGTDAYYHSNFGSFVDWVRNNPTRFVATTVQDYLQQFPPAEDDVIHLEDGSGSGADNGDPQFLKWTAKPNATTGYSADRNSWAVLVAAGNRVLTVESIQPHTSIAAIIDGSGNEADKAWHYFLNAQTSEYWYWDDSIWETHPTRAANLAVQHADAVLGSTPNDTVAPSIFPPQRDPYNPGGVDLGATVTPSDFQVWTLVYDCSGVSSVTLWVRVDDDGTRTNDNDVYSGGTWSQTPMAAHAITPQTSETPLYQAEEYTATVHGLSDVLVDYYVEGFDSRGNHARTAISHVYVRGPSPDGGSPDPRDANMEDALDAGSTSPVDADVDDALEGGEVSPIDADDVDSARDAPVPWDASGTGGSSGTSRSTDPVGPPGPWGGYAAGGNSSTGGIAGTGGSSASGGSFRVGGSSGVGGKSVSGGRSGVGGSSGSAGDASAGGVSGADGGTSGGGGTSAGGDSSVGGGTSAGGSSSVGGGSRLSGVSSAGGGTSGDGGISAGGTATAGSGDDAGTSGGADAGIKPAAPSSSGCSCHLGGAHRSSSGAALSILAGLAMTTILRRRKRRG